MHLDERLVEAQLAETVYEARELISSGRVEVNGDVVKETDFSVRAWDGLTVH